MVLVGKGRQTPQETGRKKFPRVQNMNLTKNVRERDDEEISKGISAVPVLDLNFQSSYFNHKDIWLVHNI